MILLFTLTVITIFFLKSRDIFDYGKLYPYAHIVYFTIGLYTYLITDNENMPLNAIFSILLGLFGFYCGKYFFKFIFGNRKQLKLIHSSKKYNVFRFYILGILLVMVSIPFTYSVFKTSGIPLFMENIDDLRGMLWKESNGYIVYLSKLTMPAYVFFNLYLLLTENCTRQRKVISIILMAYCLFQLLSFGSRGGVIPPLFISVVLWNYLKKPISGKKAFVIGILSLLSLGSIAAYRWISNPNYDVEQVLSALELPSILLPLAPLLFNFENGIVAIHGIIEKTSISDVRLGIQTFTAVYALMPGYQAYSGVYVKELLNLGHISGGKGMAATTVGSFYLDFWYPGIFIGLFIMGICMELLYRKAFSDLFYLVIYALILCMLLIYIYGNFLGTLLPIFYIFIFSVSFFVIKKKVCL